MAIVRWNPMRDLMGMRGEMDALFDNFLGLTRKEDYGLVRWAPRVNIEDVNGHYELTADLPGLKKDDIKIDIQGDILTIKGERKLEEEKKNKNYTVFERCYGTFQRAFTLPENVERDKIQAEFKDGVLKLDIPKIKEEKPKEITIEVK